MADVGREASVALDAVLQRRDHLVERGGEEREVAVVADVEAGVEVAACDRLGRLRRVRERPHRATARPDAEQRAEQGREERSAEQMTSEWIASVFCNSASDTISK